MKTRHRYLKYLLFLLALACMLFFIAGPLLPRFIDINSYQNQIVSLLENSLKRKISFETIRFDWHFGPEFVISGIHIRELDSMDELLSAQKITFPLRILPLLSSKVQLGHVVVEGLKARIIRDKNGVFNIADLIEPGNDGNDIRLKSLRLKNAEFSWHDSQSVAMPVELKLSGIELYIDKFKRGKNCKFGFYAKLPGSVSEGTIKTVGTIKLPEFTAKKLSEPEFNGSVELKNIEYCRLWPYFQKDIPFSQPGGTADIDTILIGTPSRFDARGVLRVKNARVVWPGIFNYPVAPKLASIDFNLKREPSSIDIPSLQLNADGFSIKASIKLTDLNSGDPYLKIKAVTETFEYKNVQSYVPYGIIEKDASYFIENKIKAGIFKLDNGTLEGRLSKLARFTEGDNANLLYITGTAENAVVLYSQKAPAFKQIKGTIELKGRNFNLHNMSGQFGHSPFTMNGSITEYSTSNIQSEYPFQMLIKPKPTEVAWLAAIAGVEKLSFNGESTLHLTGEGPVKSYRLSGDWQLLQAEYSLPEVIRKPAGMPNSLTFSSILTKQDIKLTALSYSLHPLQLSALATLRYSSTPSNLSFEIQTNQFKADSQLPIIPVLQKYQPKGILKAHIIGNGDPAYFSAMQFSGDISLAGLSIKPFEQLQPLTAINGNISFKGNALETSNISAQFINTPINFRCRIASLKKPETELFITSPELHTSDFGLDKSAPSIKNFSANIGYNKGLINVRNTSGRMKKSIFSASGNIKTGTEPDINLKVAATHLDIDELFNLIPPEKTAGKSLMDGGAKSQDSKTIKPFNLNAQINAVSVNYKDISFKKFSAALNNRDGLLHLKDLHAGLFGGRISASGYLERASNRPNRWNLSLNLLNVHSDQLFNSIGINREIKGLMTVSGNLRADGDYLDSLKKTASGNLSLRIERGILRRFNSLSKVVSILNISQLLTFKLPDMSTEGMPFNHITATAAIKDGIISGQDFFIDSNVMNVSMIGKVNIVKEDLDLLIGVQPLQTVDKAVSRLPVVGWLLTGGDGSLVTTYFEAKGPWSDPEVTAIPVKSMATGALDIFRRVFELPVRLFTDTGEVILGSPKERPKAKE